MEKEFIPYEQALALKELGFNEPCFAFYRNDRQDKKLEFTNIELAKNYNGINSKDLFIAKNEDLFLYVSCPTFSQAFRWFREKYDIYGITSYYGKNQYFIELLDYKGNQLIQIEDNTFNTYEEAELECLKKLIEIVKDGENR